MRKRNWRAAALGLLVSLLCVAEGVRAQPSAEPVLALEVEPGIIADPAALRGALERELGVQLSEGARGTAPTLSVRRVASGNVEVSLASRSLARASRELVLRTEIEAERLEVLTLIAVNLVRNEAAALLPDLRPLAPPELAPPPPEAAPSPAALASPCARRGRRQFGIDFAPGVGSSSSAAGKAATRSVSLGFLGTLSARLQGGEVSLGANVKRVSVCGAQIALALNLSQGETVGLQAALVNVSRKDVSGLQTGIFNYAGGSVTGVQDGLANFLRGSVTGAQGGLTNYVGGSVVGVQGGLANVVAGDVVGVQGGLANVVVGDVSGAQGGLANVTVGRVRGLQAGLANVAVDGARGAQLGLVNVSARTTRGVQIGLFNYAESTDFSLGLISIIRRGRTSLDFWYGIESEQPLTGVTHGGRHFHQAIAFGERTRAGEGKTPLFMYALGVRPLWTRWIQLDIDLTTLAMLREPIEEGITHAHGVRVPVTVKIFRGLRFSVAPSYQFLFTRDPTETDPSHFHDRQIHQNGTLRVLTYPGVSLGLHWEFDHGATGDGSSPASARAPVET